MERAARAISKSMLSYLKRAREHKEFLLKETKEFDRSKRHLANMMGINSDQMTQSDIDEAINYLFPSGLFDKRARPMMKHPDLLFKAQKDAQFDVEGRPHHYLFYTAKPNYHEAMSDLGKYLRELDKYEDEQIAKGINKPPEDAGYFLSGKIWLSHEGMCEKFIENISEDEYEYLVKSLNHLQRHPYSARAKTFIEQFTQELKGQSLTLDLPEIKKDEETGALYTEMITMRREHEVKVRTILNGSGKVQIEDHDILFFTAPYLRKAVLAPLKIAGMQDKVDIIAKFVRVPITLGQSAIASAIRLAVARSLAAYSDSETRTRLRLAGLLLPDTRRNELKKFGQEGARRKYTWKRR